MADLPAAILPYAEVALSGRLEDGNATAHRGTRITIDVTDPNAHGDVGFDGKHLPKRRIWVAACDLPNHGRPVAERWTCSAGWANLHGAQACTADKCHPDAG